MLIHTFLLSDTDVRAKKKAQIPRSSPSPRSRSNTKFTGSSKVTKRSNDPILPYFTQFVTFWWRCESIILTYSAAKMQFPCIFYNLWRHKKILQKKTFFFLMRKRAPAGGPRCAPGGPSVFAWWSNRGEGTSTPPPLFFFIVYTYWSLSNYVYMRVLFFSFHGLKESR